jgi:two-component system CheB/CheR fusion protein
MLRADTVRMSPGGVLRDVVDGARARAAERGLALDLSYDGELPATIESDPMRLRQILLNLIGNAIKFTTDGGIRVAARLRREERLFEISVSDTGIGIAPEQEANLFEPFSQGDSSVTRQYGGTGLGLSITKRLVALLGGSISVTSTPNVGSRFVFTVSTGSLDHVPAAEPEPERPQDPVPIVVRLRSRRILVVDDRRDMRYLIQSYIEEAGGEVVSAANGAEALEKVAQTAGKEALDAIVLDMQKPVMDGYATARRLREIGYVGNIIALTASAMKGDRERCLEAGCDEYLTKPADRSRLLLALTDASAGAVKARPEEASPATASAPEQGPGRVLVVDDNDDSTEVLRMLIETHGLAVITAATGAQAIALATSARPDIVVLDLGLPDVDGYAVLEHLQQVEALRATTFIALTGRTQPEDVARIKQAGFHHQFAKPPNFTKLIEVLRAELARRFS